MRHNSVVLMLLVLLLLLPAACQPIAAPPAADQEAATAEEPESSALPGFTRYTFPDMGVSIDFPDGWIVRHDPKYGWVIAMSDAPETMRAFGAAYWWPGFEEPITSVNLQVRDLAAFSEASVEEILKNRFQTYTTSELQINPKGVATVSTEPKPIMLGEQDGVEFAVEGIDDNLRFPFRSHIIALTNGERIAFLAMTAAEANEAAQVPVFEEIAGTVTLGEIAAASPYTDRGQEPLTLDQPVTGNIPPAAPRETVRDLWPFSGQADQQMTLIVAPLGDKLDLVIDVLDAEGKSILEAEVNEVMMQTGSRERVTFNLPADGDYFAVARSSFQTEGDYQLTLYEGFRAY
jgi:hypothetical protein